MTAKQKERPRSYGPHQRRVTQQRVCESWVSAAPGPTGVVCVGELSHRVSLGLHSKEDGKEEERKKRADVK